MTGTEMKNVIVGVWVVVVILFVLYQFDPTMCGLMSYEGFATKEEFAEKKEEKKPEPKKPEPKKPEPKKEPFTEMNQEEKESEGFANLSGYEGPAQFSSAQPPAGCYPRDQLTPSELLPKDMNSVWAEQNPMGPGSLKGKNFLSAGALIGVNTVGQSMRNANLQVRSEPPNPQVAVSIFNQSTISPDISHRPLEIGA